MRKPRQEMMIPTQNQGGERTGQYHKDKDSVYMAPASKTDDGLITVSFNQTKSISHREKNKLRSIETVSKMISHI